MRKNLQSDLERLKAIKDEDIDLSDIPELDEEWFKNAVVHPPLKKSITIRLDADVLNWFKSQGPGYQTRINMLLRKYMEAQQSLE